MANYLYVRGNLVCYNLKTGKIPGPNMMYLADASGTYFGHKLVVNKLLLEYTHLDTYPLTKKNITEDDCLDESGIEKLKDQDYEIYLEGVKVIDVGSNDRKFNNELANYPNFEQVRITIYEDWIAPDFIVSKDTDEETMKLLVEVEEK